MVAVDGLSLGDLSAFGGVLADTVGFDRLSEEGAVYVDTFAPSPWPEEALAGALTGRTAERLDGEAWTPSLAETLQHDGYRTALILGHEQHLPPVLPSAVSPLEREGAQPIEASAPSGSGEAVESVPGFGRTIFAEEARSIVGARADDVVGAGLEWLASHAEPAFLAVTFGDPRPPHHLYRGLVPAADAPYGGPMAAGLSHAELLRRADEFTEEDLQRLAELHATEVAMVDQAFQRLAGALIQRRRTPPVLIVIGVRPAALGQRGHMGLVPSLDPNSLQVPMLIRFPEPLAETPEEARSKAANLRGDVTTQASLIDLAPTVLDALGFEPRYDIEGRSLFPGARLQPRPTLSLTDKGIQGGTLIDGDEAVRIEFNPTTLQAYQRPDPASPFTPRPLPPNHPLSEALKTHLNTMGLPLPR